MSKPDIFLLVLSIYFHKASFSFLMTGYVIEWIWTNGVLWFHRIPVVSADVSNSHFHWVKAGLREPPGIILISSFSFSYPQCATVTDTLRKGQPAALHQQHNCAGCQKEHLTTIWSKRTHQSGCVCVCLHCFTQPQHTHF